MAQSKTPSAGARCPICTALTEQRWRPFCSRRCADIDLGRWMRGSYAIPSEDGPLAEPGTED